MLSRDTHFQPPRLGRHQVVRRRLALPLRDGAPRRLTLVLAPAGYGKTSLASQWYGTLAMLPVRSCWLSLTQEDRDQTHFLLSLLRALDAAGDRDADPADLASLSVSALLAVLLTRIREVSAPLVLFLDDYQAAQTDPTESIVAKLLYEDNAPNLSIVLLSRTMPHVPVSRLRLDDEFQQIDVKDLRFTASDAEAFFADSPVPLSAEQIARLAGQTEGWAVALQMVRLLLAEPGADADRLVNFGGVAPEMGRYLAEQVLSSLPAEMQDFLLDTAALPELSAELAAAAIDRPDAADHFRALDLYPLPLAHLDGDRRWVRHHPVFRDYLAEEAERQVRDCAMPLRRAASWFERRGEIEAAVRHALLAGDAALAADIVEAAGGWQLIYVSARGGVGIFRALLMVVAALDLAAYPRTTLGLAIVSAKAGQQDAASHYLLQADGGKARSDPELRVVRALLSLYSDRPLNDHELSELENDVAARGHAETVQRGLLLNLLSFNYLDRTELDRAGVLGERSIRCLRDNGAHFGAMHLYCHIGQAAFFSGNSAAAEQAYAQLIAEAQAGIGKGSDLDAIGQVLLAELEASRGNFAEAHALLDWALPHVERHDSWFDILAAGLMTSQMLAIKEADFDRAHMALDQARRTAQRRSLERLRHLADTEQFRLLLASGEDEEAARFARRARLSGESAFERGGGNLSLRLRGSAPAMLWARLRLSQGDVAAARAALERLRIMQSKRLHVVRRSEFDLFDIRLLLAENRREAAAELLSALALEVPVLDYRAPALLEGPALLAELVQLASMPGVAAVVRSRIGQLAGDPGDKSLPSETRRAGVDLTSRERMVLKLLGTGATNKDIGRRLDLTDNTVKFHLKNIFCKMRVTTRLQAVSTARELGLLA